eukprot:2484514-Pleurochrysis_carterae.AAC.2
MKNERNASREEPQPMAQVDNPRVPRGEPNACNHLMLYHACNRCRWRLGSWRRRTSSLCST